MYWLSREGQISRIARSFIFSSGRDLETPTGPETGAQEMSTSVFDVVDVDHESGHVAARGRAVTVSG